MLTDHMSCIIRLHDQILACVVSKCHWKWDISSIWLCQITPLNLTMHAPTAIYNDNHSKIFQQRWIFTAMIRTSLLKVMILRAHGDKVKILAIKNGLYRVTLIFSVTKYLGKMKIAESRSLPCKKGGNKCKANLGLDHQGSSQTSTSQNHPDYLKISSWFWQIDITSEIF